MPEIPFLLLPCHTNPTRFCIDPWFCLVFGNQFTPDDLLDNYPVDRLMHDIALTLMAVQTQTTSILSEFPTKAAPDQPTTMTETNPETTPMNETAI